MRQGVIYCNRTATGLVQASTQRTKVTSSIANTPLNKPNYRTHQDGLERTTSDCGSREGRGFEPRRSPSLLQDKYGVKDGGVTYSLSQRIARTEPPPDDGVQIPAAGYRGSARRDVQAYGREGVALAMHHH
jgi:hypothetical protein